MRGQGVRGVHGLERLLRQIGNPIIERDALGRLAGRRRAGRLALAAATSRFRGKIERGLGHQQRRNYSSSDLPPQYFVAVRRRNTKCTLQKKVQPAYFVRVLSLKSSQPNSG